MTEIVTPFLEVSPDAGPEDGTCYGICRHMNGRIEVWLLNAEKSVEVINDGHGVHVDGLIDWHRLSEETLDELVVSQDVDVEPEDVLSYQLAADNAGDSR